MIEEWRDGDGIWRKVDMHEKLTKFLEDECGLDGEDFRGHGHQVAPDVAEKLLRWFRVTSP